MKSLKLTHQVNKAEYSYSKSLLQQIHYRLNTTATGKYANSMYINEFITWLKLHILSRNISTQNENKFLQLNMKMLYSIFIIKKYIFPEFSTKNINNNIYVNEINKILKSLIPLYNDDYEYYYYDITRYIVIYNLIKNDNYIFN